jgi:hypothetical protein
VDNPTTSKAGLFAGHVLALQLNVDFSNVGKTRPGLANLKIAKGKLNGWSVLAVLNLANSVLGGGAFPSGLSMSVAELSDIVAKINGNFDGGKADDGYLKP